MLTPQQAQDYRDKGFLVLPQVFSDDQLETLKRAAAGIVSEFDAERNRTVFKTTDRDAGRDDYFFDSAEQVHCFFEEEALDDSERLIRPKELAINKIGHALHDRVPEFTAFCSQPIFGQLLRDLGYHTPQLWQTMYIYKQPGIGGEVRWHQDASYLISDPPTVTGVWIALEDATLANGCLWVSPGAHRSPLREIYEVDWNRRQGKLSTLDETPWPSEQESVPVEIEAGGMVVFHDHMPHCSSPNRSPASRQALTLHFTESSAGWVRGNWLQRPTLPPFLA
jgi:phytanoyl-CoA hydroxylase